MGDWEGPKSQSIPPNVEATKRAFDTFTRFVEQYERIMQSSFFDLNVPVLRSAAELEFSAEFQQTALRMFHQHMDDDFNTGGATGVLFDLVRGLNKLVQDEKLETLGRNEPGKFVTFGTGAGLVRMLGNILGLTFATGENDIGGGDQLVSGLMQLLLDLRANLRTEAKSAAKDNPLKKALFDQTDLIRTRLAALGVTLEDRPAGTTWRVG
jgi:cysteinyl-tRNA synthetase